VRCRLALAALLSAIALVASSCGSSDGDSESPPAATPEEVAEAPDATPEPESEPEAERDRAARRGRYQLVVDEAPSRAGARPQQYAFRIERSAEQTVRDFQVEHTKRMHLIVVRSDLSGFQHLHPEQDADGSWRTKIRLDAAGSYRLFADFSHDGEAQTLASDLRVDGAADLRPLPDPSPTAVSDGGYDVRLEAGHARPGEEADLRFTITRNGAPVETEPYLGAGGHLVALREGDLAFLHVHPMDGSVRFAATFPTEGRYRLFLQFQHEGHVQTVAFTQEVR
jgi:hypothetical protein